MGECTLQQTLCSDLFLNLMRVVPMWLGVGIAFSGYRIGKEYFNKTQGNSVSLDRLKRFYDCFNRIKSEITEFEMSLERAFGNNIDDIQGEALLEELTHSYNCLDELTRKALFVEGFKETRLKIKQFYNDWFVESQVLDYFLNRSEIGKIENSIKEKLFREFEDIKSSLNEIESHFDQEVKSLELKK